MANNQNQNQNAIQHGLAAAKQAAQEEGMTNKVEELANDLQQNAGATDASAGQMANDANQSLS